MERNKSAISPIIGVVIVLAFFIIIMTVLLPMLNPKPPIEVIPSLSPSTIKENGTAKLTLTVKNLDLKTHEIKFVFDTSTRITIYAGAERRLHDNTYSFTLEASDPSEERVFTVTGSVEEKVASSEYLIKLKVYVDGNELVQTWNAILLTIRKS